MTKKAKKKVAKKAVTAVKAKKSTAKVNSSVGNYKEFIFNTFNSTKKPMLAIDIINLMMKQNKVKPANRPVVRLGIARELSKLTKTAKTIKSYLPKGQKNGSYYGLSAWFAGANKLKPAFQSLIKA